MNGRIPLGSLNMRLGQIYGSLLTSLILVLLDLAKNVLLEVLFDPFYVIFF